jgi:hypothetical protein
MVRWKPTEKDETFTTALKGGFVATVWKNDVRQYFKLENREEQTQILPLLGVAGAWALKMLPSAIMPSRWSCLSSQILNQNVMRLQQLARGVLDGGYRKLVGNLRLQNA